MNQVFLFIPEETESWIIQADSWKTQLCWGAEMGARGFVFFSPHSSLTFKSSQAALFPNMPPTPFQPGQFPDVSCTSLDLPSPASLEDYPFAKNDQLSQSTYKILLVLQLKPHCLHEMSFIPFTLICNEHLWGSHQFYKYFFLFFWVLSAGIRNDKTNKALAFLTLQFLLGRQA